jgi:hypothetical protein
MRPGGIPREEPAAIGTATRARKQVPRHHQRGPRHEEGDGEAVGTPTLQHEPGQGRQQAKTRCEQEPDLAPPWSSHRGSLLGRGQTGRTLNAQHSTPNAQGKNQGREPAGRGRIPPDTSASGRKATAASGRKLLPRSGRVAASMYATPICPSTGRLHGPDSPIQPIRQAPSVTAHWTLSATARRGGTVRFRWPAEPAAAGCRDVRRGRRPYCPGRQTRLSGHTAMQGLSELRTAREPLALHVAF